MNTGEKIYTQHADHTEWLSKLKFYTDEISILKGRLEEIASKNNQQNVLAQVEHFQNQLIVQKNNIDEISHTIKLLTGSIELVLSIILDLIDLLCNFIFCMHVVLFDGFLE